MFIKGGAMRWAGLRRERAAFERTIKALERAAGAIETMGCRCVGPYHRRGCEGRQLSRVYLAIARRARRWL
jgi:hypothetical protein